MSKIKIKFDPENRSKNKVIVDGVDIADKAASVQIKIEPDYAIAWIELRPDEIDIEAQAKIQDSSNFTP